MTQILPHDEIFDRDEKCCTRNSKGFIYERTFFWHRHGFHIISDLRYIIFLMTSMGLESIHSINRSIDND